jgi:hypothetical protein
MTHATVADLTIEEFKSLIREVVAQTLAELLGDPDEGLELRDDFTIALTHSLANVEAKGSTISLQDAAAKYGMRV